VEEDKEEEKVNAYVMKNKFFERMINIVFLHA